jgi:hypothetical protein
MVEDSRVGAGRASARTAVIALSAVALCASLREARAVSGPTDPTNSEGQSQVDPAQGVSTGHNIVVAPIPISNPSVGTGLALTGMILYKMDADSPESSTDLGGGYLSSHSWLVGAGEKLNFDHDLYRLNAALGFGQINYNFYGIGADSSSTGLPLEQKVFGGMVDLRRKIVASLHVGLRYTYADVRTSLASTPGPLAPVLDGKELDLKVAGLGLVASWDTRDREFAPTHGTYAEFKSNFASNVFGSDLTFQTYSLSWNAYYSLNAPNVLAARVYLCRVSQSAPFFDTCAFGSGDDLRGYEAGRYRDLNMISGQAEYRVQLFRRFGAVVFAGAGSVAPTFGDLFSSTVLPDAGLGLRFLAVPSQGVNISVDYAWGRNGSSGLYVYIGDAF